MQPVVSALLGSLSFGGKAELKQEIPAWDPVGGLARVYEVARNAMDYRAEHLVRRAAIERIIKRQLVFDTSADHLAEVLKQELRMARYAPGKKLEMMDRREFRQILSKQIEILKEAKVDRDWLMAMFSAEVEEQIDMNIDYQRFTTFAFHVFRARVQVEKVERLEMCLYAAVDRTYSQSDEAQVSYHLYKLAKSQLTERKELSEAEIVETVWKNYQIVKADVLTNHLAVFVRKQMGPLVLIRDMYFAEPMKFSETISEKDNFMLRAREVLDEQLGKLEKRISTAATRSLIYVFLTKMIFGLLLEIPAERWISGAVNYMAVVLNTLFPVVFMMFLTSRIRLPDDLMRERLVNQAWGTLLEFADEDDEIYTGQKQVSGRRFSVFYALYLLLFLLIFWVIVAGLRWLHLGIFSSMVFIFFLTVVSFFAYRIRQTTQIYNWRPKTERSSSWGDALMLPIVVVGGALSREVSKLNFLVFVFDFILEAPFKTILRFLDSWSDFLSRKRDEVVG